MSQENANVVRGAVDAWNTGDMDRLRTFYDPEVVVRPLPDWPDAAQELIRGRDQLMQAFAQIREPWAATDVLEILGALVTAGDRVIVRHRWKAEGHGPPLSMEMTYVHTVRNGRIVEIEIFWDHAEALEAARLSEYAMSQQSVEVVLGAHAAYSRGDLDGFLAAWHPEGVYRAAITQAVEGETADFTGHSGLRQWWDDLHDVYDDLQTEVLDVHQAGERFVVVYISRGRTRSSGITGEEQLGQVVTVRSGKIVEVRDYLTPREALEAVELSEQTMAQENVEVVSRVFVDVLGDGTDVAPLLRDDAAWTKRRAELEAIFEPNCAVAWIAQGERPIEATGLDESRQAWLDWLEPWETYHAQIERIIPVGDRVVALTLLHGRMAGTQKEVEMVSASVYLVREGRVARVEHYANRADALEAVGLSG